MLRDVLVLTVGVIFGSALNLLFSREAEFMAESPDEVAEKTIVIDLLERRLQHLESVLFELKNQNQQIAEFIAKTPGEVALETINHSQQIAVDTHASNQIYEDYSLSLAKQISVGIWSTKQQSELAEVLPKLSEDQKHSVLIQIVQAHQSGDLMPDRNAGLFQ